jgi:DNA-binding transcriptional ArsR family regulator
MQNIKAMLLQAPDSQLDHSMFPLIEKWDEEPTSLQILEVLDQCIFAALASGFTVTVLQAMLNQTLVKEKQTLDDILPQATWRNREDV